MAPDVAKAAPKRDGAPEISEPMLRAATSAVRAGLHDYGIDSQGISEMLAKAALEAALGKLF
jgi:hypothetical protein